MVAANSDILISRTVKIAAVNVSVAVVVDAIRACFVGIFRVTFSAYRYILIALAPKVFTVDVSIAVVVDAIGASFIVVFWVARSANGDVGIA